jgi:hypothetical protein
MERVGTGSPAGRDQHRRLAPGVQPQAGALFGYQRLWLVVVSHLFKYPAEIHANELLSQASSGFPPVCSAATL